MRHPNTVCFHPTYPPSRAWHLVLLGTAVGAVECPQDGLSERLHRREVHPEDVLESRFHCDTRFSGLSSGSLDLRCGQRDIVFQPPKGLRVRTRRLGRNRCRALQHASQKSVQNWELRAVLGRALEANTTSTQFVNDLLANLVNGLRLERARLPLTRFADISAKILGDTVQMMSRMPCHNGVRENLRAFQGHLSGDANAAPSCIVLLETPLFRAHRFSHAKPRWETRVGDLLQILLDDFLRFPSVHVQEPSSQHGWAGPGPKNRRRKPKEIFFEEPAYHVSVTVLVQLAVAYEASKLA